MVSSGTKAGNFFKIKTCSSSNALSKGEDRYNKMRSLNSYLKIELVSLYCSYTCYTLKRNFHFFHSWHDTAIHAFIHHQSKMPESPSLFHFDLIDHFPNSQIAACHNITMLERKREAIVLSSQGSQGKLVSTVHFLKMWWWNEKKAIMYVSTCNHTFILYPCAQHTTIACQSVAGREKGKRYAGSTLNAFRAKLHPSGGKRK